MRLTVTRNEDGLHPSQVSVSVNARDGLHCLVLDKTSIDDASTVDIGDPVARRGDELLVELPSETDSGTWRLWVNRVALTAGMLKTAEVVSRASARRDVAASGGHARDA